MEGKSKLLLNWKSPYGNNYLIAVLQRKEVGYTFFYIKENLSEAKNEGFKPFIGFSDIEKEYHSLRLFSIFERRLPNKHRADFLKFLEEHQDAKISDDVVWSYLHLTQGILATDSLSFLRPVTFNKKRIHFCFDVAGWTYTKHNNRSFTDDDLLQVRIDLGNPKDVMAVEIIDPQNNYARVGYVPRPFNKLFFEVLNQNINVEAETYYVDNSEKRPSIMLTVSFCKQRLDIQQVILKLIDKYDYMIEHIL